MSRSTVDPEWERRKEYLIRSLFQDPPPLSPIQQEEESVDSAGLDRNVPRSPVSEQPDSPDSSLPSLIIEVEPKRHYYQEHSDEFYEQLRKRVLKVYRELFKKDKSDVSSSDSSDGVDFDAAGTAEEEYGRNRFGRTDGDLQNNAGVPTAEKERGSLKRAHTLEQGSITSEASTCKKSKSIDDENNSNPVYIPISTSEESNKHLKDSLTPTDLIGTAESRITSDDVESEADTTSSLQEFILVTIQADVHKDFTDDRSMVPIPSATYVIGLDENATVTAETDGAVERDVNVERDAAAERESLERHELLGVSPAMESNKVSAILENNGVSVCYNASQHSSSEEQITEETEVMRTPRIGTAESRIASDDVESEADTTSSLQEFIQVTIQADVHKDFTDDRSMVLSPSMTYFIGLDENAMVTAETDGAVERDVNVERDAAIERDAAGERDSLERHELLGVSPAMESNEGSAILENNGVSVCYNASQHSSSEEQITEETEVMRTPRIGTTESRIASDAVESEADTSSSLQEFIQVTIQADVHKDFTDDRSMVPSPSATYVIGIDENAAAEADVTVERDVDMERESLERHEILGVSQAMESNGGSAILEKNGVSVCYNASQHSSSEEQITQEIEVMRTPGIRASHGSLQHEDQSSCCEDIVIAEEPRILEHHTESSSSEERDVSMRTEMNFDFLHRTSTPVERYDDNESHTENHSGSSGSEAVGRRSVICEDVGVQTDDYGRANRDILNNLFIGVPLMFRLCSCINHSCGR